MVTTRIFGMSSTSAGLRARRLLDTIQGAKRIAAAASNPAVTSTGTFAPGTLVSNAWNQPVIAPNDAALTVLGTVLGSSDATGSTAYYRSASTLYTGTSLDTGGTDWGFVFMFDGQALEITHNSASSMRLKVDGEWTTQVDTAGDFQVRTTKFDFGSRAPRRMEVRFKAYMKVLGFNIAANDRVWKAARPALRGMIFGDSYVAGSYATMTIGTSLGSKLSEFLGADIAPSGVGGQGYATADPETSHTLANRVAAGDLARFGALDLVILNASVNDTGKTPATVQAAVTAATTAAMAAHPNAFIYGISGYRAASTVPSAAINTAFLTGFTAAMDPVRMATLDGYAAPSLISIGGNDSFYVAGDNVHPQVPNGIAYLAKRIVDFIATDLLARAA